MEPLSLRRLGLVVHPRREIDNALDSLRRWSDQREVDLVQVPTTGQGRRVAEPGDPADCDLIVALGGDGTTLAAIRAAAAVGRPVLGVPCGSLGALTATTADELVVALDRVAADDWIPKRLPAVVVEREDAGGLVGANTGGGAGAEELGGGNDVVVVRQGAGQISAAVHVDGELFIRIAGDGMVVATAVG